MDKEVPEEPGWTLASAIAGVRADVWFAGVDAVIISLAYFGALMIRFVDRQGSIGADWWDGFWAFLPVVIGVHLLANALSNAYGQVWEYASIEEAVRLAVATLISAIVLVATLLVFQEITDRSARLMPLTVVLMGSGIALGGMGMVRFRSRLFSFRRTVERDVRRAIIVGTGREAADLARRGPTAHPPVIVVGFVDDSPERRRLAGIPVLGGIHELPELVSDFMVSEVLIATSLGAETVRRVVDTCVDVDVRLRALPGIDSVMNSAAIGDVRDLELTDLLPRPTVTTDLAAVGRLVADKRVLVTGAGGSIGSEIVSQVAMLGPCDLIALDNDEGHLYEASLAWSRLEVVPELCLVDIRDQSALNRAVERFQPEIVFHAAAHKHVPMLELFPEEAVKTNVAGTHHLIQAARHNGVERFVLISTDKAVEPSSVMGASKRVAEMMIQNAAKVSPEGMVFSSVRFGNVLGSRGSVIPTFMQQIKAGGPVTVSDPEMLRYFMLTSEAVELVLQAAALAKGGEVFVLDMGEPVRIGDLAHRMIRLAGLVPERDISIAVTGARPGEKMVEILSQVPLQPSCHPKISLASTTVPGPATMFDAIRALEMVAEDGDRQGVRDLIMALAWQTWQEDEHLDLIDLLPQTMGESA